MDISKLWGRNGTHYIFRVMQLSEIRKLSNFTVVRQSCFENNKVSFFCPTVIVAQYVKGDTGRIDLWNLKKSKIVSVTCRM